MIYTWKKLISLYKLNKLNKEIKKMEKINKNSNVFNSIIKAFTVFS
jgi:hypothetical protein